MADDFRIWKFFVIDNKSGVPVRAIWLQAGISILMVLTSSFEQVFLYSGFILQLFTTLTVVGVLVLRWRKGPGNGYRSPFFPWIQILYVVFSLWILVFLVYDRPYESLLGLVNLVVGAVSYFWSLRFKRKDYDW